MSFSCLYYRGSTTSYTALPAVEWLGPLAHVICKACNYYVSRENYQIKSKNTWENVASLFLLDNWLSNSLLGLV